MHVLSKGAMKELVDKLPQQIKRQTRGEANKSEANAIS